MAEDRPFAPSPRRRALAQRAGLSAASAVLVGAAACTAVAIALGALGHAAATRLGASVVAACRAAERAEDVLGAPGVIAPGAAWPTIFELALPLLVAAALAALAAHLGQTRVVWFPRRKIPHAPALEGGPAARTRGAAFELASASVVGGVALAWLWLVAPRLARLPTQPLAGAALVASALATLAIAWVAIGVLDALLRHAAVSQALRMTARERKEDERLAGIDPRWRSHRASAHRASDPRRAMSGSTLLLLGDDRAVAIAWDPLRRPIPVRTATGQAARVNQLLGLARQHRVPVHRDPILAAALAGSEGPVPERHWSRLAEIVAALGR